MDVNPNEAPEGYVAVKSWGCDGCAFDVVSDDWMCKCLRSCISTRRKDECSVIFVKKPDDGKATSSWPYDSEGTPVEVPHA